MKKAIKILLINQLKQILSLVLLMLLSLSAFSQNAGISPSGAIPPNSSAGLDVNFSDKGILIPRVALTGTNNFAPLSAHIAGMLVFNTATTADVVPGYYYNNGTKWIQGIPKGTSSGDMQYWNGTTWVIIPIGTPGQKLQINGSGVPVWVP